MLVLLNDSSDTPYSSVIGIPHTDSCAFTSCMNDLVISNVDRYMSYTVHYLIADQISWLGICIRYLSTCILLLIGGSRKADSEVRKDTLYKSGAVCTIGKACSAPYVWISNKLCRIIYTRST